MARFALAQLALSRAATSTSRSPRPMSGSAASRPSPVSGSSTPPTSAHRSRRRSPRRWAARRGGLRCRRCVQRRGDRRAGPVAYRARSHGPSARAPRASGSRDLSLGPKPLAHIRRGPQPFVPGAPAAGRRSCHERGSSRRAGAPAPQRCRETAGAAAGSAGDGQAVSTREQVELLTGQRGGDALVLAALTDQIRRCM